MLYGLSLLAGIVLLFLGGESLIRGAVAGAKRMGVSPLLTGLVVVGFGTSAPELVVSVDAAIREQPDIAVGNIVGSNIGNILLILGLCAVICPMNVHPLALRRDGVVVVAASLLFIVLAWSGALGRWEAALLLAMLTAYLMWAYWTERNQSLPEAEMHSAEAEELSAIPSSTAMIIVALVLGLIMLIGGSQLLLYGAIGLAQSIGISEAVI
ncbi:sodium:calcium antiporter, partial [Halomonas sp. 707B3]|uniref:sodium:calcium antiporter n=1 Tax=Halomonas sp. 707B3 TaxID=1681043 RepID=UPI0020A0153E